MANETYTNAPLVENNETLTGAAANDLGSGIGAALDAVLTKALTSNAASVTVAEMKEHGVLKITGPLTGAGTVTIAAGLAKKFVLENATTGAYALTVKVSGQTGVTLGSDTQGESMDLRVNGTDVVKVTDAGGGVSPGAGRPLLTGDTTYYVNGSTGDDGDDGSSGNPWLTIQHAIDAVSALDNGGFEVTIQLADGTYSESLVLKSTVGGGRVTIQGNGADDEAVVIEGVGGTTGTMGGVTIWAARVLGTWRIKDLTLTNTGNWLTRITEGSVLEGDTVVFGDSGGAGIHMLVEHKGIIDFESRSYRITDGSTNWHAYCYGGGTIRLSGATIDISGTPSFAGFALAQHNALFEAFNTTITGSISGAQYDVSYNATIAIVGTTLPGSGTSFTTGGQVHDT